MDVVAPVQEFHLDGEITSPFMSAPSSPKRIEFYYHYATAPASPTAASACSSPRPKSKDQVADDDVDDDFAFDFSGHLGSGALPELTTADELFEKGKLLPLKCPLQLCSPAVTSLIVGKHSDPFSASMTDAAREGRGRNRAPSISSSRSRKGSRSLSPMRNTGETDARFQAPLNGNTSCSYRGVGSDGGSTRKWCFKDLLLFRSASEGRATGNRRKDPLRKYTAACALPTVKKGGAGDESRGSSFRLADGGSSARRESGRGIPSPHAIHYTTSRAAAEEMKKRTALPYKEGFFSFRRFAPGLSSFRKKC